MMNNGSVSDRMVSGLIQAEAVKRQVAEDKLVAMKALLVELAYRINGAGLDALRKQDPTVPESWSPAEWRTFFMSVQYNTKNNNHQEGWGNGASQVEITTDTDKMIADLGIENARLTRLLSEAEEESARLRAQVQQLLTKNGQMQLAFENLDAGDETPLSISESRDGEDTECTLHEIAGKSLSALQIPKRPVLMDKYFPSSILPKPHDEVRYRREVQTIFIIATFGLVVKPEYRYLISQHEGLSYNGGNTAKIFSQMEEHGLLTPKSFYISKDGFRTNLHTAVLSEQGLAVCEDWGWPVVENELARIERLHEGKRYEEHTGAILMTAMHARLRGWIVAVLPEALGKTPPDMMLSKQDQSLHVEVELGRGSAAKWKNLKALGKGIGIVALNPQRREHLIRQAQRAGVEHGKATDLMTMVQIKGGLDKITPEHTLWAETW
jgi:hypothetical protein